MKRRGSLDEDGQLEKLLELVPPDGSPIGNIKLLKQSGLSDDDYWQLRNRLIEQGRIGKGRGKGGSVHRLETDFSDIDFSEPDKNSGGKRKKNAEKDIYNDFEGWLKNFWVKDSNLTWYSVEKTAHQGGKNTGGKWTRPDFAVVGISTYKYYPGKSLEVVSFEVKPSLGEGLAGVFECAAHSVYATRSYLALHVPDESELELEEFERIERECERFGLGLVVFSDPKDIQSYDVRVGAVRRTPDPGEVDKFIASQLKEQTQGELLKQIK